VTDADYPAAALGRGAQGTVRFRLIVDEAGVPQRCEIAQSSGDTDLDRVTCDIMLTRARFHPARDSAGRPVGDRIASTLTWRIREDETGMPFRRTVMENIVRSSETGALTCTLTLDGRPGGESPLEYCGFLAGSGAERILRGVGGEAEMTLVFYVLPEGEELESRQRERGERLAHREVQVTVSPEGRVSECRTVSAVAPSAGIEAPGVFDPCTLSGGSNRPFFAPAGAGSVRKGRLGVTLFMRRGPPL
jgi:TonB family protein